MPRGRPRKPSYDSIQNVISAIEYCSCGKSRNDPISRMTCDCVGPKTPTELLRILNKKIGRNALYRTLKFLVDCGVLTRTRLKKHGNYVAYSIRLLRPRMWLKVVQLGKDRYEAKRLLVAEMEELPVAERKLTIKLIVRSLNKQRALWQVTQLFQKKYGDSIHEIKAKYPQLWQDPSNYSDPSISDFYYLVGLVDRNGLDEGVRLYFEKKREKDAQGLSAFRTFTYETVFPRRIRKILGG